MTNWTEDGIRIVVTKRGANGMIAAGTHEHLGPNPCHQVVDGASYVVLRATTPDGVDRLIPVSELPL